MLRWEEAKPLLGHAGVSSAWQSGMKARRGSQLPAPPMMQAMMAPRERQFSFNAAELEDDQLSVCADEAYMDTEETASVADGGGGTATFHVERVVSIDSDAKPHKVTVAIVCIPPSSRFLLSVRPPSSRT